VVEATVIIPCWIIDQTLLQLTQRCIQSVRETSNVELILIDNGSNYGSNMLRDEADIYVRNQYNAGYVKAINQGIKLSSAEYIVCGNNDYMMKSGWVKALKVMLDEVKNCGIACPHVEGKPTQKTPWVEHGTPGGWYMIKFETIAKVGLLDEKFKNVFADFDFCWRLRKHDLNVISTPHITVVHYGEATIAKDPNREKEWHESSRMLIEKWKNEDFAKKLLEEAGLLEPRKSV